MGGRRVCLGGAAPLRGGAHQQGPAPRSGHLEAGGCGGEGGRTRTALPPARRAGRGRRRVAARRGAAAEVVRDRDQCEVRPAPALGEALAAVPSWGAAVAQAWSSEEEALAREIALAREATEIAQA